MLEFIVTFTVNIIDAASILLMFLYFMAKEVKWNYKMMWTIGGVSIVMMGVGSATNIAIVDIAMFGLPIAMNFLCTKKRLYNILMVITAFMFYVLWYACFDYVVELMFGLREQEGSLLRTISMIVADGIRLAVLIGIIRYCKKKKVDTRLNGVEILGYYLYFIFFLLELFMMQMLVTSLKWEAKVIIGFFIIIFMLSIFGVYTGYLITKRKKKQMESHVREIDNYLDMQMKFLEQDKENQQQMRQLKHDLRNHLQVMKELYAGGNYKEAEKYAESLYAKADITTVMHMIGNEVADIVLSAKKEEALKRGIEFLCEGEFQSLRQIEPVDVCTIFSNVLDNALEAAEKVKNGKISIQGISHKNYYTLIVTNSIPQPVKIKNNQIVTTKKDKKNHGIGLIGVQKTAHKYHGECLLSCGEHEFTTKVILLV